VTLPAIMHSFVQLLVAGTAVTGAFAQYNDGYETVNLPTDPVQIRLAYQGPTAMMGKHLGAARNIY
jgi:acid phosphatase type 7